MIITLLFPNGLCEQKANVHKQSSFFDAIGFPRLLCGKHIITTVSPAYPVYSESAERLWPIRDAHKQTGVKLNLKNMGNNDGYLTHWSL